MNKFIDLSGKKFGRLTVVSRTENSKTRGAMWICVCECGNKKIYCGRDLRVGDSNSCGCLKKDMLIDNKYKYNSNPIEKRLDKYIDKSSGAWMWIGALSTNGYGKISYKGEHWTAHRLIYTLFIGDIHEGLCVCHKNDIKLDVTPSNLFLGTNQENTQDMVNKGRQARGENHGMAKLNEKDVIEIRESFKNGISAIDLINKFNMDKSVIYDIINGNIWKHI